jgi:hypothetical protein
MIYDTKNIITLIQFEYSAFEEATVPVCTFVIRNMNTGSKGEYIRLVDYRGGMEVQRIKALEAIKNPQCGYRYSIRTEKFRKIPGSPVAYWASDAILRIFKLGRPINKLADVKHGLSTGKNTVFVREWWEINYSEINFGLQDRSELENITSRYFPYNKGGEFRLWYGNVQEVVWYDKKGREKMQTFSGHRHDGKEWYFKQGITWSFISSSKFGVRLSPSGFIFDVAGSSLFPRVDELYYLLGFLSSTIGYYVLMLLNPTLNFQVGNIKTLPIIFDDQKKKFVDNIVKDNITISRTDWDSFETSWDFKRHSLLPLQGGEK